MDDNIYKKHDKAILFIANRSYLFALGTMIVNIQALDVDFDEIIVINSDFEQEDKKLILDVEKKCRFIDYTIDDFFSEFFIDGFSKKGHSFIKRYSHLSYIKIKIFELLEHYRRILFLDLDMLIKGGIDYLFNLECDIAWRSGENFETKFSRSGLNMSNFDELGFIDKKTITPNGGLFFVRDTIDYKSVYKSAKEFIRKYVVIFSEAIDELAFSFVVYKENLRLEQLDRFLFNSYLQWANVNTYIIHFAGGVKPWNNVITQSVYKEWILYYKEFSKKVNKSFDSVKVYNNIGHDLFRPDYFRKRWQEFLGNPDFVFPYGAKFNFNLMEDRILFNIRKSLQYEVKTFMFNASKFVVSVYCNEDDYKNYFLDELLKKLPLKKKVKKNYCLFSERIGNKDVYKLLNNIHNFINKRNLYSNNLSNGFNNYSKRILYYKICGFFLFWKKEHYQKKLDKIRQSISIES